MSSKRAKVIGEFTARVRAYRAPFRTLFQRVDLIFESLNLLGLRCRTEFFVGDPIHVKVRLPYRRRDGKPAQ
jgi:hypothetical protein